jgi:hypothetical protein
MERLVGSNIVLCTSQFKAVCPESLECFNLDVCGVVLNN